MTPTRYFIARVAQAFGYYRRNQRMGDAANEMHLLRDAEMQFGAAIWEKVEAVEELSVEYWNLRKLNKEREIIQKKLIECQARLDLAHEERSVRLNNTPEVHHELSDQRVRFLADLEKLEQERDEIVAHAREVRRNYDGLKMKLEVLSKESADGAANQEQVEKVKSRLIELKTKFAELKDERVRIGQELKECEARINLIGIRLNEKKKDHRISASETFHLIGDGNREIATLRAEDGVLYAQMRQLYTEIGRYVSRNAVQSPACAAAASSHRGFVDLMHALRRSIDLNQRLSGNE